ncbi:cellulose-binding domain-containing protein, partial [Saccharophagus degradans]|uniref:cellulose binding domain-containing protein n=1 Tax=Saccharophagus degradans TaxID=86304 RepID=UPI001C08CD87|nr:cellulose-binding domain-containing protein [Saccharophagus degradans]
MKRAAINLVLIPGLAVSMGTLSSSAFAQSTCSVDYRVESDWGAGATHKVLVTNTGAPINGWQMSWTFSGNEQITNLWNGMFTQSSQNVIVDSLSWNAQLNTGATAEVGFNINSPSGQLPDVYLNGVNCSNPGEPEPEP